MTTHRLLRIARLVVLIYLSLLVASCTIVHKPPQELVSGYPSTNVIPLKVGLVLNDKLHAAKWELKIMSDKYTIPLGENLPKNSESLIRKLFSDVIIGKNETEFSSGNVDVIAIPTMVSTEQTSGTTIYSESKFMVILEWKFQDKNGKLIWVDTVQGEGTTISGSLLDFKEYTRKRIKIAIDNLFKNSHESISNSQEIKEFTKVNNE